MFPQSLQQWQPPLQECLITSKENYEVTLWHPWSQWRFVYIPSNIWQQRNSSDCFKEMFCTESKRQSPNYSSRNLRISSQVLSLTVSSEAGTAGSTRSKLSASSACRTASVLPQRSERCPVPLWTLAQAAWLSCQHDSAAAAAIPRLHTELLNLVQSLQLHHRSLQKLYLR